MVEQQVADRKPLRTVALAERVTCVPVTEGQFDATAGEAYKTGAKALVKVIQSGVSKNRALWSAELLAKHAAAFEGCKVYVDHKEEGVRSFNELAGRLKDVQFSGGDLIGVLETLSVATHLRCALVEQPENVGLSVYTYVTGDTRAEDGVFVVESIEYVRSVDVVDEPAAGGGILRVMESAPSPAVAGTTVAESSATPEPPKEQPVETPTTAPAPAETPAPADDSALKALEAKLAEQAAALEAMKAENATLVAEKRAADRAALLDAGLAAKALKPSVAALVRKSAEAIEDLTAETLDALCAEWTSTAEAIAKDYAPAVAAPVAPAVEEPAQPEAAVGVPPATESVKPRVDAKTVTEQTKEMVYSLFGC